MGAPVVLSRNFAGYASLGRHRQGRWGIGEKKEVPFKMASAFLKDRRDICVPVELLAGLIDEQRWVLEARTRRSQQIEDPLEFSRWYNPGEEMKVLGQRYLVPAFHNGA